MTFFDWLKLAVILLLALVLCATASMAVEVAIGPGHRVMSDYIARGFWVLIMLATYIVVDIAIPRARLATERRRARRR